MDVSPYAGVYLGTQDLDNVARIEAENARKRPGWRRLVHIVEQARKFQSSFDNESTIYSEDNGDVYPEPLDMRSDFGIVRDGTVGEHAFASGTLRRIAEDMNKLADLVESSLLDTKDNALAQAGRIRDSGAFITGHIAGLRLDSVLTSQTNQSSSYSPGAAMNPLSYPRDRSQPFPMSHPNTRFPQSMNSPGLAQHLDQRSYYGGNVPQSTQFHRGGLGQSFQSFGGPPMYDMGRNTIPQPYQSGHHPAPPDFAANSGLTTNQLANAGLEQLNEKKLYENFRVRSKPKNFYKLGRVFMVLWTEPLGSNGDQHSVLSNYSFEGAYGERVCSKIRRFIVVSEHERHCLAIPILSYNNHGVSRQGINRKDHGIVYTGASPPAPRQDELPPRGEQGMVPEAIRVTPDDPTEKLAPLSRIHYGKVQTIEHNVKARSFGVVHNKSQGDLVVQLQLVLSNALSPGVWSSPGSA